MRRKKKQKKKIILFKNRLKLFNINLLNESSFIYHILTSKASEYIFYKKIFKIIIQKAFKKQQKHSL